MSKAIRVLVIDDSALMRKLIPQILEREPSIQVVGTAMDGSFGLQKIADLKPHVVTLDLEMPRMDGQETLRAIMKKYRVPVIVVSAHTREGASATFKALAQGAFDFVAKPAHPTRGMDEIAAELIRKIKVAAQTEIPRAAIELPLAVKRGPKPLQPSPVAPTRIIGIGISTGGPNALQYLLTQLPGDFPGAILVVQHMPQGFTRMFAERLDECCAIEVKEAASGDLLVAGRALICPGNRHMRVRRMPMGDIVVLSDDPPVNGHRPSADVLLRSVAREFGPKAMALLMTGMGEDGADAMGVVKDAGGLTIAQSENSCVVYGMPRAAVERGHAMRVVHLDALANTLVAQCDAERARVLVAR
jgi:two-component system chemotaxis response regulator CheB